MTAVQAVVEAGGQAVTRLMDRIEERMSDLAAGHGTVLGRYAGDTIAAGGKRLRPLLVCVAAGVPPPETAGLVRAAVAVELVHGATLVHDDVLDGSPLRRGRPTVVAAAGRGLATATGDLLFSRAFAELVGGRSLRRSGSCHGRVWSWRWASCCNGPMRGTPRWRWSDISSAAGSRPPRCFVRRVSWEPSKVAVRSRRSARLASRSDSRSRSWMTCFDVSGPPERTGKPRGADLLDGTVTLPLIVARSRDPELAGLDVRDVRTVADAAATCERIAATGALGVAKARAFELVARAKSTLPLLPDERHVALGLVADGVVERYA